MKKNLTQLIMSLGIYGSAMAQTNITGPSSSQSPYFQSSIPNATVTSILTVPDAIGGYTMCGIPDGLGAFDNGNGTFTLLMNHEIALPSGSPRAHGSNGAFVSKWIINKSTLAVVSGADLMQNVNLWTGTTYTTYNATSPSTLAAFSRFCSADLPPVSAFYNSSTGKGTQERIYMNGEESGNEGRALAHIVTGAGAGNTYELPYLGKASWENYVANPYPNDKTIVIGMDDTSPLGQVYVYIGNKTNSGTDIAKAGLTGGKLYGVAVLGLLNETTGSFPSPGTVFNLIDMGAVQNITGTTLNTNSNNMGVTNFLRPEDGCWDPAHPRDFYFNTTDAFSAPSRVWRLRFTDLNNPEMGGTITAVLDGSEGQNMLDNMTITNYGHLFLCEDVGNNAWNGRMLQYDIANDVLTPYGQHDPTRFISGGANFLTQDEETSGVIDAQAILGPGMYLVVTQAHYLIPNPVVEGGQLMAFYNPASALLNPEINVQGNSVSIPSGNATTSSGNNTSFGSLNLGNTQSKTYVIQNAGPGILTVNGFSIGGVNAGDFSIPNPPVPQSTIAANATLSVTVQFAPAVLGLRNAVIYVKNNDFDESNYSFAVDGSGTAPEINLQGNSINITDGNTAISSLDNTDFGSVQYNTTVIKSFNIQNTGTGALTISGMVLSGTNTSVFNFVSPPTFPLTLAAGASQAFSIQYLSTLPGTHMAMVSINNSDADESIYDFTIEGKSFMDVGINSLSKPTSFVTLFPNPSKDEATLKIKLENNEHVVVNVYDIQGKNVMMSVSKDLEKGEREITLNTSSLKSGEYFVQINSGTRTDKIKMVVIH